MKDYLLHEYMDMPDSDFLFKVSKCIVKRRELIFASHWHEHMELLYFISGRALVKCAQNSIHAGPGDLVVVNSNELHAGESLDDELVYYCMIFDLSLLRSWSLDACQTKYLSPVAQNTILFENIAGGNKVISECVHSMIEEYENKEFAYEISIKSTLYRLLAFLLRNRAGKVLTAKEFDSYSKRSANIKKVLKYVEANYTEKITLHKLSEIAGISRFYFCRSFKEVTGQTVSDYVNYVRVCMAEAKLENTGMSITDIALSVGFDDINYFSRIYKKHKGMSPSAARKSKTSVIRS